MNAGLSVRTGRRLMLYELACVGSYVSAAMRMMSPMPTIATSP